METQYGNQIFTDGSSNCLMAWEMIRGVKCSAATEMAWHFSDKPVFNREALCGSRNISWTDGTPLRCFNYCDKERRGGREWV